MIIKSFTAPTIAAALKMVKEVMGGEAVVLRTREIPETELVRPSERVEVTACIDEGVITAGRLDDILNPEKQKLTVRPAAAPATPKIEPAVFSEKMAEAESYALKAARVINKDVRRSLNAEPDRVFEDPLQKIYLDLLDADVPSEFARQMMKIVSERLVPGDDPVAIAAEVLTENIAEMTASEPEMKAGKKAVFVGTSGAGKTSALAKMAARLISEKKLKIRLASLDDIKVTAFEEIEGYADILDVPVVDGGSLGSRKDKDSLLLVDTPPIPLENRRRLELIKRIRAIRPDYVFMVFSVTSRTRDMMESLHVFESLTPTHLIASHLDESGRWGGMVAMARYLEIPLVYTMNAPGGIGRLKDASAEDITRQLMNAEEAVYE